jgi:hypothetical protein
MLLEDYGVNGDMQTTARDASAAESAAVRAP